MLCDDGRIVPDFIVIGAMKSGTTTLDRLLRAHPHIGMSRDKETDFFVAEKNFAKGAGWYAGQFDRDKPVHGEASPNYTKRDVFAGVPERIKDHAPDAKLIFIVRDPAARAISQYRHSVTMGDIAMGPSEFVGSREWSHVVATSSYARQLEPYLALFARDKILIVDFDTLTRAPQGAMDAVFDFVGVLRMAVETQSHNEAAELARVPTAALRLSQSPLGRAANRVVGRAARDRVRKMLAVGKQRAPDPFPDWVMERLRRDLEADAQRFRTLAGRSFEGWSV